MKLLPVLSCILLLAGCAGTSPAERFYTLQPRIPDAPASDRKTLRVAIAPVTVPDLVDRPQLVLRASPRRVVIMEQSRWAEPLKSAIASAMAGNLARLLDSAQVGTQGDEADVHIQLDVLSFESHPGVEARIEMAWIIRNRSGERTLSGQASEREVVTGSEHESLVAAHEQLLARISRRIAADIRQPG